MITLLRKVLWWLRRGRREAELHEELQFHLAEEATDRRAGGLPEDQALRAARRDLGNVALVQEDARALWSWTLLEQLVQDVRYGLRTLSKSPMFTGLAALSLALGIGANAAIFSFMDAILLRALPVPDPASLVVLKWRARPVNNASGSGSFVMRSIDGTTYEDGGSLTAGIFPYPAVERMRQASPSVLSSLFAYKAAGRLNVMISGEAELVQGEYVSGDFFDGIGMPPAAGRLIAGADDRAGAAPVAVLSFGYSRRRFGDPAHAAGQIILVNNVSFTVVGVAASEFFGVDPASAPDVYLPMHASRLFDADSESAFSDEHYYWVEMMGRLKAGVGRDEAANVLAQHFAVWVAPTATNDQQRGNLPVLWLDEGAGGLDSLRRQYSQPLYLLMTMVGLILAIACANTANLLLARAAARKREIAVRLGLGASRWRLVRQLLTESVLLALLSGALGILIAVLGMEVLTRLLANGQEGFTLHADLNLHVLGVAVGLSLLCGALFGLAPALQATRPALMAMLRDRSVRSPRLQLFERIVRLSPTRVLLVGQIALSLLLLVAAGLFARTLSSLQSISLGFNDRSVLLFDVNAPQAGYPQPRVVDYYGDLRERLSAIPGVRSVTLSHSSLITAGRSHPITVDGRPTRGTRILYAGPGFFTTMQVPVLRGREILERDRAGRPLVAVVSDLFARNYFGDQDPIGRRLEVGGSVRVDERPLAFEIVGIAATAKYGSLKRETPPVLYLPYAQLPPAALDQMTYALRTENDPLQYAAAVRQIVRAADERVPVTNVRSQTADIERTINQEIVFARLCSAFAVLALTIACVGLYATMAYGVARRANEIGLRMALGAGQWTVVWMVLREACVLAVCGLAIGIPAALATSRLIESFLFGTEPNDPGALALASAILLAAALAAGYGPARRAARVDPMLTLRHE